MGRSPHVDLIVLPQGAKPDLVILGLDGHAIFIWRADSGSSVLMLGSHSNAVRAVMTFHPLELVASGTRDMDRTICIWRLTGSSWINVHVSKRCIKCVHMLRAQTFMSFTTGCEIMRRYLSRMIRSS